MNRTARPRLSCQLTARSLAAVRSRLLAALAVLAAMVGLPSQSWANCTIRSGNLERTPDANLVDNGNGTITHTTTGLMWKKCPEGRTYSAGNCTGTTGSYPWQAALRRAVTDTTGGNSDWRLPSRTELLSIVETACTSPTINTTRFPNVAASAAFWTSTHAGATMPDSAYAVRFSNGTSFAASKDFAANARLVRAGNLVHDNYRANAPSEPAAFSFISQIANPGDTVTSNTVSMSGLTASRAISITGGEYKIGTGAWTSANGTIANGNTLQLRVTAPNTVPSSTSATVNVNGRTATFLITTGAAPPDSLPDPFAFVDQAGVMPSTLIVSAPINVQGINLPTDISITGGEYEINSSGAWTSDPGVVLNHDFVSVRHTSSASYNTAVNTVLTIGTSGTVSDTFTSTTGALDATPDAFAFIDQGNVAPSTLIESNDITVSGINAPANISITGTGAEYQIDGGSWTSSAGTVTSGQTVRIRHTSSASYSTAVNATLTIGGVSDTFTTTTAALDTTPDDYSFTSLTGVTLGAANTTSNAITVGGINGPTNIALIAPIGTSQFQIRESDDITIVTDWTNATSGITVSNGQIVRVRHTTSSSYSTSTVTTLTIGGLQRTFTTTTTAESGDTTPDPFSFTARTGVTINTEQVSDPVSITGVSSFTPIAVSIKAGSVAGSSFEINNSGTWVTTGSIQLGDSIKVKHTSSGSFSTPVTTTLIIGGVEGSFTSTTEAQDTTPDAFSFTDQTSVPLATLRTSNTITVSGINSAANISITGGQYQIGAGAWTSTEGTVTNGQTVTVRHTSSASTLTTVDTVLNIGGVTDTFSTTTLDQDLVPDAFGFTDQTNVSPGALVTSNSITVSGITGPATISVTGGEYQIGAGAWTSTAGTISNGNTVRVRHTASLNCPGTIDTVLTIGGVSDTFSSTTVTTAPPNPVLTFATVNNANRGVTVTSELKTVFGICNNSTITRGGHTSGTYSVDGGTFGTTGTINPGQTLRLRMTSNSNSNSTRSITVTIGGATTTWTVNSN